MSHIDPHSNALLRYPSDFSDEEWKFYSPHFPEHIGIPGVQEAKYPVREVMNAIRYKLRTGCPWVYLPKDLPPWGLVTNYFYTWKNNGRFAEVSQDLAIQERLRQGRKPEPTAVVIDSKSVQTTEMGGPKGFDKHKNVKGRKRHILVDVLGILLLAITTPASMTDQAGGAVLLTMIAAMYPTVTKTWVDGAYKGPQLDAAKKATGIDVEITRKPDGVKGFVPIKKRWVVERTLGWMNWSRELSKEFTRTTSSSVAWMQLSMSWICSRRLAGQVTPSWRLDTL